MKILKQELWNSRKLH
ncbi:hypothetical protein Pint_21713 [Pistacia integerrima]|uniref:Uncharacterized protein n=1 Tax=Pistacia integerrima TaxID=434235 RepID=A0ACC0XEI4_9ROSI|nr:hypothetical protein Pint_21713 [Pistacia integerrima]